MLVVTRLRSIDWRQSQRLLHELVFHFSEIGAGLGRLAVGGRSRGFSHGWNANQKCEEDAGKISHNASKAGDSSAPVYPTCVEERRNPQSRTSEPNPRTGIRFLVVHKQSCAIISA